MAGYASRALANPLSRQLRPFALIFVVYILATSFTDAFFMSDLLNAPRAWTPASGISAMSSGVRWGGWSAVPYRRCRSSALATTPEPRHPLAARNQLSPVSVLSLKARKLVYRKSLRARSSVG